mgnify:CR=1 FL=1
MAKQEITCDDILKELRAKQYRPVYYLMGEEPYYIDLIADYITDNILTETEKEFNLTVVYGADVDMATVINAAKRYPMMSEHQVVVVKEAQNIRNMEELSYYLQKPLLSTILVICHKHGVLDRRKKLAAEIEKTGVLFESKKVKDAQLPAFITSYMKRKGIDVEPPLPQGIWRSHCHAGRFRWRRPQSPHRRAGKTDHYTSKRSYTRYPRTDREEHWYQ